MNLNAGEELIAHVNPFADDSSDASDEEEERAMLVGEALPHSTLVEARPYRDDSGSPLEGKDVKILRDSTASVPRLLQYAFIFISFGYMLPWTALGSLIAYYKYTYSASFYVKIYCAYYLPGLPVALLQYQFDEMLDVRFGSQSMYMARGVACFTVMTVMLFCLLGVTTPSALIVIFTVLGVCGWMCHGTASMLAAMYPREVIAYLQIGFRCPEIYTLMLNATLRLGRRASSDHLLLFYKLTAVVVLLALICWMLIVGSKVSTRFFEEKDEAAETLYAAGLTTATESVEQSPLLGDEETSHSYGASHTRNQLLTRTYRYVVDLNDEWTTVQHDKERSTPFSLTYFSLSGLPSRVSESISAIKRWSGRRIKGFREQRRKSKRLKENLSDEIKVQVRNLTIAIIALMWASIFQAAFFAYVESPNGWSIEQILYFVRLFSDLLGRPLTFFGRPQFLQNDKQLVTAAIVRMILLAVFFLYTFVPNFPKSDIFIIIFVGIYSVASGYLSVLIYECAASDSMSKAMRTHAANTLNMGFQLAAFTAVVMSVFISSSGILDYL